ncbi:MAG TPA: NPCBM/NEW2 domain-containing protein, partial [Candidatus Limnocylindria bacterium]
KGVGVHAASEIRLAIPAGCTSFAATVGIDDEVGANGSVTFSVLGGSTLLATSNVLTGAGGGQALNVNLGSATELRLVADGGANVDYDHADWADARLLCGTTTNTAPVLAQPANQTSQEGIADTFQLAATDADTDPLTYGASGLPPGLSVSPSTGLISGTPSAGSASGSPYTVTATVSDGRGGTDDVTFTWSVSPPAPPAAPTGLTAQPTTEDTRLAWTAVPGAAGYHVYRATSATGTYSRVNGALLTSPSYVDTTAAPLASSWYRVTAVGASGIESSAATAVAHRRIQLVATTTATNNGLNVIQLTAPAGRQVNDLMLATVTIAGAQTITPPTGWTLVRVDTSGTALRQAVYSRFVTASEPATASFSLSSPVVAGATVGLYRGVSTSTPIDAHSGRVNAASLQIATTALTTTTAHAAVVGSFGVAWNTTITVPATMLDQAGASIQKSKGRASLRMADIVLTTPSSTGSLTATSGRSAVSIAQLVALRPASP